MQQVTFLSFHHSDIFGGGGCHFPWLPLLLLSANVRVDCLDQ